MLTNVGLTDGECDKVDFRMQLFRLKFMELQLFRLRSEEDHGHGSVSSMFTGGRRRDVQTPVSQ